MTAAYELFARHGVQAVGIDAIIERSGVARQTLYRHFGSKQELVLAFLERREEVWTYGWLAAEVQRRERDPRRRLLAIFDVFDEWFRDPDFEGCSFINVMLEHPAPDHPLHQAAAGYLARIRGLPAGAGHRRRDRRSERLRAPVAHPDEGVDRGRRRGRPRRGPPSQADRAGPARAGRGLRRERVRSRKARAGSRRSRAAYPFSATSIGSKWAKSYRSSTRARTAPASTASTPSVPNRSTLKDAIAVP